MDWVVNRCRGGVGALHGLDVPTSLRSVWVLDVERPSIALGSTQGPDVLAAGLRSDAAPLDVARRRSGGGLVRMNTGEVAWIDVVIPHDDPLWRDDVGEAFLWLGEVWAESLRRLGVDADVHRGPSISVVEGRVVCFAGVGEGEVVVGDRKVVGLSQRRTRDYARFQCLVHQQFDPSESLEVLAPELRSASLAQRLREHVGVVAELDALVETFLDALPSAAHR